MNAVLWLELRIRIREKRLWVLAVFFVITLFIGSLLVLSEILFGRTFHAHFEPATVGEGLGWATLLMQAGLISILAPLASAGRISQEREQQTLIALLNSPTSRWKVVIGKLLGCWLFVIWLWTLALPFLSLAVVWNGFPANSLFLCATFNLLAGLVLSSVALGFSSYFGRTMTSYLVTGAFSFTWMVVFPMLGTLLKVFTPFKSKLFSEIYAYLCWYHHPFYPIAWYLSENKLGQKFLESHTLIYCLSIWFCVSLVGALIAYRGLRGLR